MRLISNIVLATLGGAILLIFLMRIVRLGKIVQKNVLKQYQSSSDFLRD